MDWTRIKRLTTPERAVSLACARDHLRIVHVFDDALIERLIDAATAAIEGPHGAGIPLNPASWQLTMDHLPRSFDIDLCPVVSIDKIAVDGIDIDPSSYRVDLGSTPARVVCDVAPTSHKLGSVKVEFTAGYAETIPADLVHAILMLVAHYYEHREAASAVDLRDVPFAVTAILSRYRAF